MFKKIIRKFRPSFTKQLEKNLLFFNKTLHKCNTLDKKLQLEIEDKQSQIESVTNQIYNLKDVQQKNNNLRNNIEKLLS